MILHDGPRARHRRWLIALSVFGFLLISSRPSEAQSTISLDIPISLRAEDVQRALESAIGPRIKSEGAWTYSGGWGLKYLVVRSPFTVTTTPNGLMVKGSIEYRARGCRRTRSPWPWRNYICPQLASCGHGEPMAGMQLSGAITGRWAPDWSFHVTPTVTATPARQCRVTAIRHDVSPRIAAKVEDWIRNAIPRLGNRLHFRAAAEARWAAAGVQKLADQLWLVLRPEEVAVGPLVGTSNAVQSSAAIRAKLEVVAQDAAPVLPPLPALTVLAAPPAPPSDGPPGTSRLTLTSPWADLARAVSGQTLDLGDGITGRVKDLRGTNDGRVVVTVAATGTPAGDIVLDASARYDAGSDSIVVDDLRGAPGTGAVTSTLLAAVSAALRPHLRWPVAPRLDAVLQRLSQAGWIQGADASPPGQRIVTVTVTVTTAGIVLDVAFAGSLTLPASLRP